MLDDAETDAALVDYNEGWPVPLDFGFDRGEDLRQLESDGMTCVRWSASRLSLFGASPHFVHTLALPPIVAPTSQEWMLSSNFGGFERSNR